MVLRVHRVSLGTASVVLLGVAFARVWVTLLFVDPGIGVDAVPLSHDAFDISFAVLNLAAVLFARHLVPLSDRRWSYTAVLGGMLAVSLAFSAGLWFEIPSAVRLGLAAAGGAAYAGFLLLNAETFAGSSVLRIVLYLSGSRLVSSLLAYLFGTVDGPRLAVLACLLPFAAVGLIRMAYAGLDPLDRQPRIWPTFSIPWKTIALIAIFSFAYGLDRSSLVDGAGQHASFSTALAMGAVLVCTLFLSDRVDVARLVRAPAPLMVCGLMLMPTGWLFGQAVSSYLISIAYTLATFSMGVLVYDMSKRTGVPIVPLVGLANAMQVLVVVGAGVSHALSETFADGAGASGTTAAFVCAALVLGFGLLFSERELSGRWGTEVLRRVLREDAGEAFDRLGLRCDEVAAAFGLTPRETEVLRELARGKTVDDIARNLVITPGTLKVHMRHIYEKAGVHSRDGLYELLGAGEGRG